MPDQRNSCIVIGTDNAIIITDVLLKNLKTVMQCFTVKVQIFGRSTAGEKTGLLKSIRRRIRIDAIHGNFVFAIMLEITI